MIVETAAAKRLGFKASRHELEASVSGMHDAKVSQASHPFPQTLHMLVIFSIILLLVRLAFYCCQYQSKLSSRNHEVLGSSSPDHPRQYIVRAVS